MPRRLTAEDLQKLGESGQSGGTLGESEMKKRQLAADDEDVKKPKRGYFKGRRDKRTVLDRIKAMAGYGEDDE